MSTRSAAAMVTPDPVAIYPIDRAQTGNAGTVRRLSRYFAFARWRRTSIANAGKNEGGNRKLVKSRKNASFPAIQPQ